MPRNATSSGNARQYVCELCVASARIGKHAFTKKADLDRHKRSGIHGGERRHPCPHCDKKFVEAAHLKTHLRLHRPELRLECGWCGAVFKDYRQRIDHWQRHHAAEYAAQEAKKRETAAVRKAKKQKRRASGASSTSLATLASHVSGSQDSSDEGVAAALHAGMQRLDIASVPSTSIFDQLPSQIDFPPEQRPLLQGSLFPAEGYPLPLFEQQPAAPPPTPQLALLPHDTPMAPLDLFLAGTALSPAKSGASGPHPLSPSDVFAYLKSEIDALLTSDDPDRARLDELFALQQEQFELVGTEPDFPAPPVSFDGGVPAGDEMADDIFGAGLAEDDFMGAQFGDLSDVDPLADFELSFKDTALPELEVGGIPDLQLLGGPSEPATVDPSLLTLPAWQEP